MLIQVRQEEITKRDNKIKNLNHKIRNIRLLQQAAQAKTVFSDADKLMILEGVLLAVAGTEALEPITRKVLASFSDNDFWKKHRLESIDKILIALANK